MKKTLLWITAVLSGVFMLINTVQAQSYTNPDMVLVKGGSFTMGTDKGDNDEAPPHKVTLGDYYIGKFEVTNAEFKKFIDATGYITDGEQPDTVRLKHGQPPRNINNGTWKVYVSGTPVPLADTNKPVGNISWNDAMAYCKWLSKMTGKNFSLPTEAEWEFAARGGANSKGYLYSGSNNLNEVAWFHGNSDSKRHSCGQKLANELGIYDMSGNIREWCADWYGEQYYKQSTEYSPQGPERGKHRIIRGGAWGSPEERMRFTYRNSEFPYNSAIDVGLRLAISGAIIQPAEQKPKEETGLFKDFDEKGMVDIYGIYFDIGKWNIKPESNPVIDQIVTFLKEHPAIRVEVQGHTDITGTDAANQTLSEKRAESIKAEIIKRGIDAGRLQSAGYGSSRPIADNKTAAGRTQNRRVTIKKL